MTEFPEALFVAVYTAPRPLSPSAILWALPADAPTGAANATSKPSKSTSCARGRRRMDTVFILLPFLPKVSRSKAGAAHGRASRSSLPDKASRHGCTIQMRLQDREPVRF